MHGPGHSLLPPSLLRILCQSETSQESEHPFPSFQVTHRTHVCPSEISYTLLILLVYDGTSLSVERASLFVPWVVGVLVIHGLVPMIGIDVTHKTFPSFLNSLESY